MVNVGVLRVVWWLEDLLVLISQGPILVYWLCGIGIVGGGSGILFGGVKHFDILSRQICFTRSSWSWFSGFWRHFWRHQLFDLICFSTTAVMVLEGVGCSVTSISAVLLVLFSKH